jgi:hypothetical protein
MPSLMSKAGFMAEMPPEMQHNRALSYPDFMQKDHKKNSYVSTKTIGIKCSESASASTTAIGGVSFVIVGHESYLNEAEELYVQYCAATSILEKCSSIRSRA